MRTGGRFFFGLLCGALFAAACGVGSPFGAGDPPMVALSVEPMAPAPIADRVGAATVWTGAEVLYWGGVTGGKGDQVYRDDGAAYDPAGDSWRQLALSPLEPRSNHAAVWTGSEMIVFGGILDVFDVGSQTFLDAAAYDPAVDSWRSLPPAPPDLLGRDVPALANGSGVLGDQRVFFPGANGVLSLDLESEQWLVVEIPTDGLGLPEPVEVVYHDSRFIDVDGTLFVEARAYGPNLDRSPTVVAPVDSGTGEVGRATLLPEVGFRPMAISLGDELAVASQVDDRVTVVRTEEPDQPLASVDERYFSLFEPLHQVGVEAGDWLVSPGAQDIGLFNIESLGFRRAEVELATFCALGATPVWTGEVLVGWNGSGCIDNRGPVPMELSGGVVVALPADDG